MYHTGFSFIGIFCLAILIANCFFIGTKNPVYSLLSLIFIIFNAILMLLTLNVEFLALTLFIIYIGAIAVLFLFVIMMFNLKALQIADKVDTAEFWFALFIYLLLFPKVYSICCESISTFLLFSDIFQENLDLQMSFTSQELLYCIKYKTNDILIFSDFFYNYCSYELVLIGAVLLTAMIGSIILTFSTKN